MTLAFADLGYPAEGVAPAPRDEGDELQVIKWSEAKEGFLLFPWCWIFEHGFGWINRFRRLARDYTSLPATRRFAFRRIRHLDAWLRSFLYFRVVTNHKESSEMSGLGTKVFISSDQHNGFGVSSTIIYGPTQALLVDSQFSLSNAHRLVAEILELDRDLTQIFISHVHPDHYLGLEVVKAAFPGARVIAYRDAADQINSAFEFKIDHWRTEILGKNGATTVTKVERIEDAQLSIDGEVIEIIGLLRGDSADQTALWIPSTKTLVAADTVFSDAHLWVADARTPQDRQEWLDNLDRLESLKPETIIPGHAPADRPYDPDGIGFTRRYLNDFIRELKASSDSADLIARMDARYPNLPVRVCLEYSARILRDGYHWDGDWPESLRKKDAVIEE